MTVFICDHCRHQTYRVTSKTGVMVQYKRVSSQYGNNIPTVEIIKWTDEAHVEFDVVHIKCLAAHVQNLLRRAGIIRVRRGTK